MDHTDDTFHPFYERLAARVAGHVVGQVLISLALGLLFFVPHFAVVGRQVIPDWGWLLGVLITTAMLALYYATYTFRALLPEMELRLRPRTGRNPHHPATKDSEPEFMRVLKKTLTNGKFIIAGVAFGGLNCGLGWFFGLPYADAWAKATLLIGFFLAGFVCGMAAFGIYGVTKTVATFSHEVQRNLDYTAPDNCGGVQFVGEALLVFSCVTLIVGVMISVYIHQVKWGNAKFLSVMFAQWAWIVFPYLMSLLVLIAPAVPLNEALRQCKRDMEEEQMCKCDAIRKKMEKESLDSADRKALRDEYAYQQGIRKDLHAMGTWPHGLSASLKYLGVFVANVIASASSALHLFK